MQCPIHKTELVQYGELRLYRYTCTKCNMFHTYLRVDNGDLIQRYCGKCSYGHSNLIDFRKTEEESPYYSCPDCWDAVLKG